MTNSTTIVLAILLAWPAAADVRCGQDVVKEGFRSFEVLERCGEPAYREEWIEQYFPYGPSRTVNEWTYEFGRNKFRRLLRFENGRLTRITTRRKPVVRLGD